MSSVNMIFLAVIFLAVFGFAYLLMHYMMPTPAQQRLQQVTANRGLVQKRPTQDWVARIAKLSAPLAKLSVPEEGWEKSPLRIRFMNAGFRGESVPMIYFAIKTLLAIAAPLLLWPILLLSVKTLGTNVMLFYLLAASAIGFYLPNVVLRRMMEARQLEIFESFPDALDLMTVCIEAGLAIDAAIARVADEMVHSAPVMSEELHLVTLELRAGNGKENAFRNLAMRTGVEDVETLVSMLIQTERFGTSMADSLRVHSENLRTKRRQRAEEAAAKISLKLLFPLIFCIFPALMLVLLGPPMIHIYHALLPSLAGH